MSLLGLTWRLSRARLLRYLLTAAAVALGTGLMLGAVGAATGARGAVSAIAGRFPLVVGADVGAVSLVLGSLTDLAEPQGSIDIALYEQLRGDPRVVRSAPLLEGHAVGEYALLATSPNFLQPRSSYPLTSGRIFEGSDEVVVGCDAAAGLDLELGSELPIEHHHGGATHRTSSLRVVGILSHTGTAVDRTLLCPLDAIFESHGSVADRRVGAVLVAPRDDAALLSLQEDLDSLDGVQVALTGQTLRRLSDQLSAGGKLLQGLVTGVVLLTFLSLLLSVYAQSLVQARDVAVMRVMGASRVQVVAITVLQAMVVVVIGILGGVGVGAMLCSAAESALTRQMGVLAEVAVLTPVAVGYLAAMAAVLAAIGVQPALAAYSVEAADVLSEVPGSGRSVGSHLAWAPRVLLPSIIVVWAFWTFSQHGVEEQNLPLDPESEALFALLAGWKDDDPPDDVRSLDGTSLSIEGYMYTLGDPFTVEDFYLVGMNPRLPRCPFCYRSPGRAERIGVHTGGRSVDVANGSVRVTGTLRIDPDGPDPVRLEMNDFDVVIP